MRSKESSATTNPHSCLALSPTDQSLSLHSPATISHQSLAATNLIEQFNNRFCWLLPASEKYLEVRAQRLVQRRSSLMARAPGVAVAVVTKEHLPGAVWGGRLCRRLLSFSLSHAKLARPHVNSTKQGCKRSEDGCFSTPATSQ